MMGVFQGRETMNDRFRSSTMNDVCCNIITKGTHTNFMVELNFGELRLFLKFLIK